MTEEEPLVYSRQARRTKPTSRACHLSDYNAEVAALASAIDSLDASSVYIPDHSLKRLRDALAFETRRLQGIIRSCSERLNQLSGIAALPDELLLEIFRFAASDEAEKTKDALYLSHVSRRWRSVALACTSLWDTITNRDSASLDLILERRAQSVAPLNMIWDSWNDKMSDVTIRVGPLQEILEKHLKDLKRLDLSLETTELIELLEGVFKLEAPLLEDLTLCHFNYGDDEAQAWTAHEYFPEVWLLFPNTPQLRNVSLENVELEWPKYAHVWPSLTSLEITMEDPPVNCFSLSNILGTLATLPALESLILSESTVDIFSSLRADLEEEVERLVLDPASPLVAQPLKVPKLRKIYLGVSTVPCLVEFLRHVELSSGCTVATPELSCISCASKEQADHFAQAAVILAFRHKSTKWEMLDREDEETKRRPGWMRLCAYGHSESGPVSITLCMSHLSPSGRNQTIKVLASLPGVNVIESLNVIHANVQASTWSSMSENFPKLRYLTVCSSLTLERLITVLEISADNLLLPHLEVINAKEPHDPSHELEFRLAEILQARSGAYGHEEPTLLRN